MPVSASRRTAPVRRLRSLYLNTCRRLFPVSAERLLAAVREVGVGLGDTVFVHSSMNGMKLLRAGPLEVIGLLTEAVGTDGNILMPSFPMRGMTLDYVRSGPVFDVHKTPTMAGIVPEIFRRMPGVRRSLHPTHPVAAAGPLSDWFTSGHLEHIDPFGDGTPLSRLPGAGGKILFLGVGAEAMTFLHVADSILADRLPVPVYMDEPFELAVRSEGREFKVSTFVHDPAASRLRNIRWFGSVVRSTRSYREKTLRRLPLFRISCVEAETVLETLTSRAAGGMTVYGPARA
jgi:aminoglycoside 3-N-acetyltransferase